jgi:menaquinol-cytochrome c reductase iron-sulfur subunit
MGVLSGGEGVRPPGGGDYGEQPAHPAAHPAAVGPVALSTRRSFFGVLVGSISAVVGAMMAVPLVRFALHPVLHGGGGADWFALGSPEELAAAAAAEPLRAEVSFRRVDGWRATTVKQTVWVTRGATGGLLVLSATCPHLGCVAVWHGDRGRFVCPCHNGNFDRHGEVLSGPPPRGLDPLPVKVEGGKLWVKYRYYRQLVRDREVIG